MSTTAFRITSFFATLALALCLALPAQAADVLSMGEALNKAGRQRMLSQRIVKSYSLVGQGIMRSAAGQLADAINLFEKQLTELTAFAQTAEEKASIEKIAQLWLPFRKLAESTPSIEDAAKLNSLSEEVLAEAHKFVLLLEKRSGTTTGHLVNIAGRQRMLSQRIGKFYLLKSWGLNNDAYDAGYSKAVDEFGLALNELSTAKENTSDINAALAEVRTDWNTFNISKTIGSSQYVPSLVVRSLDEILVQMNYITALYSAIHK